MFVFVQLYIIHFSCYTVITYHNTADTHDPFLTRLSQSYSFTSDSYQLLTLETPSLTVKHQHVPVYELLLYKQLQHLLTNHSPELKDIAGFV